MLTSLPPGLLTIFLTISALAYLSLILYFYVGFRKEEVNHLRDLAASGLKLSVIVPFRNEGANLTQLIGAIAKNSLENTQLIFVNDGSGDQSLEIVRQQMVIQLSDSEVLVLQNSGTGKKAAIETGISQATGEYIVMTDADCEPVSTWIASIRKYLAQRSPDLLILPVMTRKGEGFVSHFQELDFLSLIASTFSVPKHPFLCNGANLLVKTSTFRALDPFATNRHIPTGDDIFLLQSMKKNGKKIEACCLPELQVHTRVKENWAGFFEQRIRWGSKSLNYKDQFTLLAALVVFGMSLSLFLSLVLVFAGFVIFPFVILFVLKLAVDSLLLIKAARYFGKGYLIPLILPASVLYLVYVPVVGVLGMFRSLLRY